MQKAHVAARENQFSTVSTGGKTFFYVRMVLGYLNNWLNKNIVFV